MPLQGSRVVHPLFEAHHRPVSESAMTVDVRLMRPVEGGVRDKAAGVTTFPEPQTVWSGRARVRSNLGTSPSVQADRVVAVGAYQVILPADAPTPRVRDYFDLLGGVSDPSLVGMLLRVVDVPRSGLSWQRNVGCDVEQPINRREP
ncbi:DUF6093 family protein [Micromonospora sp. NPDC049891]|uniref:DUF6093 family protein n=1 Tax=Micromonospora sp. NPDC049891 TaxID=3155655 RepID=UPI0033D2FD11